MSCGGPLNGASSGLVDLGLGASAARTGPTTLAQGRWPDTLVAQTNGANAAAAQHLQDRGALRSLGDWPILPETRLARLIMMNCFVPVQSCLHL